MKSDAEETSQGPRPAVEQPRGNAAASASLGGQASEGLGATLETLADLTGMGSSKDEAADTRAQMEALIARIQAKTDLLKPRLVEADGGYLYRQFPDRIEIVDGPGKGTEVRQGSRAYDAIVGQIGEHPAVAGQEGGGHREAEAPSVAKEPASGEAREPGALDAAWSLLDVAEDRLRDEAFGVLGWLGGDEGSQVEASERAASTTPSLSPAQQAIPAKPNSALARLERQRQAELTALFNAYRDIELEVMVGGQPMRVSVRTKYKMTDLNGPGPMDTAVAAMTRAGSRGAQEDAAKGYGLAKGGKASPEELQAGLQHAINSGELGAKLAGVSTPQEAQAAIEAYAKKGGTQGMGVDCSGFVWNALRSMSESEDANGFRAGRFGEVYAWTPSNKTLLERSAVEASSEDLTGRPSEWFVGDVIQVAGTSEAVGHIVMIYQSRDLGEGVFEVQIRESCGGVGVRNDTYFFQEAAGVWTRDREGEANVGWLEGGARVRRPAAFRGGVDRARGEGASRLG